MYIRKTDNPRMGRPTTAPRNIYVGIRLSHEENEVLNKCCEKTGKTKTEVIVRGVKLVLKEFEGGF